MAQDTYVDVNGRIITIMELVRLCQHSYSDLNQGQVIDLIGTQITVQSVFSTLGFKAYIIQKRGGWRALVFRGTDDWLDWVFNNIPNLFGCGFLPQYLAGMVLARQHGSGAFLVGHSLGGGIATFASAYTGLPAVTIFPAPIIPTYTPFPGPHVNITNIVCHGEIMTELTAIGRTGNFVRDVFQSALNFAISKAQHRRLGNDIWVQSRGDNPFEKHRLDNIIL